ncbi:TrkH-domain-containing protein [Mollisia scopiformis]|uniref:Potassium transport protein n=1 Tax=Mollisia scopiformis TaxID=149040 RepID=A0A194XVM7_MOLSC|nr:TrkH-domain-containing protein [Mollisia scopiformis]KUJ23762.1 TrkH-domain-containing protein [Mollisia scopiformis]
MAPSLSTRLSRLSSSISEHPLFSTLSIPPSLRRHLHWNFITLHYTYFISICLLFSLIFWGCSNPQYAISYTDSLFLVVSAMTEAGLNTVNLSQMTTAQQVLLWFLIVVGGSIWVSIATVHARKRVFEARFRDLVKRQRESIRERSRTRRRSVSASGPFMRRALTADTTVDEGRKPDERSEFESRHSEPRDPAVDTGKENVWPESPNRTIAAEEESTNKENGKPANGTTEPSAGNHKPKVEDETDKIDEGVQRRTRQRSIDSTHISYEHRVLSFRNVNNARPTTMSAYQSPRQANGEGLLNRMENRAKVLKDEVTHLDHSLYPTYLTRHTTGRNAQFYGLTRAEREHLGGVEYRAITLLAWIVPIYFVLWQLLGSIGLGWYFANNKRSTAEENGINPWWLGVFNAISAFNNSGMSLLDANMIPFQTSVYTLVTMGLLILAGNTAYPLFLRLILWSLLKILCLIYPSSDAFPSQKATLRFVLRYPRRVYTNLFPSAPTWWLLFMVIVLNGVDWAAFELLNIGNPATSSIPAHFRVLDGLFQALAVRSGGFYVISITSLRIGLQVLYVIMMYISVYPVVITMRHSNVYEERSLGIYADDADDSSDEESALSKSEREKELPKLGSLATKFKRTLTTTFDNLSTPFASQNMAATRKATTTTGKQFVRQQVRGQLAHDIWWLVLAILFISCIEVSNFDRDPVTYSVFNIAFEVVSGYGCVGISTGLPNEAYSFSGGWHKASKLILCAVMLRGRHRGLPVALDRAVRLPQGVEREDLGDGGRGNGQGWEDEDRVLRRMGSFGVRSRRGSVSVGTGT